MQMKRIIFRVVDEFWHADDLPRLLMVVFKELVISFEPLALVAQNKGDTNYRYSCYLRQYRPGLRQKIPYLPMLT